MWTKERIQHLLNTNDRAVERAIVAIYDRQTQDEKRDSDTKHNNHRGFRSNHAVTGSYYARIILKGWKQPNGKQQVHLNPVKLEKARAIAMQYHRQLCEVANEKETSNPQTAIPEPPRGSWAETARMLVRHGVMTGDEADRWKDEMKDREMGL